MKLSTTASMMMVMTLVQPVVLASVGYGIAQGLMLALLAVAGLLFDNTSELMRGMGLGGLRSLPMLLVLTLIPAAALLTRPMNVLRRRLALIGALETQLDPRRGLESICTELVERLHTGSQADLVALVLPSDLDSPAMIASRDEGSFRATTAVHKRLESLLGRIPGVPVSHVRRHRWDPRASTRPNVNLNVNLNADPRADLRPPETLEATLAELAQTLGMCSLHVVPLTRYGRPHGHFVVGSARTRAVLCNMAVLDGAARELVRILEQAALVDQLQEESASHERARIGRDLHDSAIQPYLGLKYAVEAVALRIAPDNPARAEVDSLATLVNGEVAALRELITGLRTGKAHGDNTLVPAMRRQVRRFADLFGIDVEIDCPASVPTTRAVASSMFHMVNEALNNIRKHTAARRVWITLSNHANFIRLVVRDDAGSLEGRLPGNFCPASITERATELGGTLQISRPDGLNTELIVQIPT
ncbi:MAG: hypothetical protein H7306_12080 [Bacteriovorax sp.]|nr:hypothetical protein [Rhizobacter sp.]